MKIENYLKEILDLIMIDDTYQYSFDLDEELSYEEEERFSDTSLCSASLEDPYQGVDAVDVCTVRIWKSGLEVAWLSFDNFNDGSERLSDFFIKYDSKSFSKNDGENLSLNERVKKAIFAHAEDWQKRYDLL
tara:strand:- start:464 stop:859 length:396 start_codon:yes stop_codon:yes gene_type:complete